MRTVKHNDESRFESDRTQGEPKKLYPRRIILSEACVANLLGIVPTDIFYSRLILRIYFRGYLPQKAFVLKEPPKAYPRTVRLGWTTVGRLSPLLIRLGNNCSATLDLPSWSAIVRCQFGLCRFATRSGKKGIEIRLRYRGYRRLTATSPLLPKVLSVDLARSHHQTARQCRLTSYCVLHNAPARLVINRN